MLAKAIAYQGSDDIFINISRVHGTGKTSLYNIFEDLFGDVVTRVKPKHFYGEFLESKFINKTFLIIDEYNGHSQYINDELKALASKRSKIATDRKFKEMIDVQNTLTVVVNTNRLKINQENLKDLAFMTRVRITPFTHVWSEEEFPQWS